MTIAEVAQKCKKALDAIPRDVLLVGILLFASSASFGLGYLAGIDADSSGRADMTQIGQGSQVGSTSAPIDSAPDNRVVASKSGTKYYPSDCAGASRISDANKVWFVSPEAARAAGYAPASNCK